MARLRFRPSQKPTLHEMLFRKHGSELSSFAGRRAGTEGAEDIVQEAFARLLRHSNPAAIGNPRAYLFRVAGNVAAKDAAGASLASGGGPEAALELLPADQPSPEAASDEARSGGVCPVEAENLTRFWTPARFRYCKIGVIKCPMALR